MREVRSGLLRHRELWPPSAGMSAESTYKSKIKPEAAQSAPNAGLGRRAAAFLVDTMVMGFLLVAALAPSFVIAWDLLESLARNPNLMAEYEVSRIDEMIQFTLLFVGGWVVASLGSLFYYGWAMTRGWQGTLGKRLMGLAVVRVGSGEPVGLWRAVGRQGVLLVVGAMLSTTIFVMLAVVASPVAFWLTWLVVTALYVGVARADQDGRAIHDFVVQTRVIADPRTAGRSNTE